MLQSFLSYLPERRTDENVRTNLSRRSLKIPRMKQTNTILYYLIAVRWRVVSHLRNGNRDVTLNTSRCSTFPRKSRVEVANRFEIRIRQRRRFLATAKLCFLRVRFGMYGLVCCFSYRSRTLRPEWCFHG